MLPNITNPVPILGQPHISLARRLPPRYRDDIRIRRRVRFPHQHIRREIASRLFLSAAPQPGRDVDDLFARRGEGTDPTDGVNGLL